MTTGFKVAARADLHALCDDLIDDYILYQPQLEAFESYWVVVPSRSVQSWLEQRFAERLGICAGIDFMLPSQALWHFQRQLDVGLPEVPPYDKQALALRILVFLKGLDGNKEKSFDPLRDYLAARPGERACFDLAESIADAFDAYLMFRGDWIVQWEEGGLKLKESDNDLLAKHPWQAALWKQVVQSIADDGFGEEKLPVHRVELSDLLEAKTRLAELPLQYPKRFSVFGVSTLEPQVMRQLRFLDKHIEIRLYWQNPCNDYWADIKKPTGREKPASKEDLTRLFSGEEAWLAGNPLLATWGQYARGFYAQMVDEELLDYDYGFDESETFLESSVLQQLKNSVLENNPEHLSFEKDNSVQIVSHWSRLREVEGLHDYLLAQFDAADKAGKPLRPHEVGVMVPDIEAYAPLIEAVFDAQPEHRRIPYELCGGRQSSSECYSAAECFLTLPKGRYAIGEVLDLLMMNVVSRQFEISDDDFTRLHGWVDEAAIHWGLDESTWVDNKLPARRLNTLAGGIDRLLMGLAIEDDVFPAHQSSADNVSAPGNGTSGTEPVYGIMGVTPLNVRLIGSLAEFVELLQSWRDFSRQSHTLEEWVQCAREKLQTLFSIESDQLAEFSRLNSGLDQVVNKAEAGGFTDEVGLDIFLLLLSPEFEEMKSHHNYTIGKVTVGSFAATRGLPFRITTILGLNDTDFPRRSYPNGINLMPVSYRLGDRSPAMEDRYTFLQAMMSCGDALYCSYVGRDMQSNQDRMPSLVLRELLDFLVPSREEQEDWIVQHPIQPFSQRYFSGQDNALFSFADQWCPNKQKTTGEMSVLPEWHLPEKMYLADLRKFLENPMGSFFSSVFDTGFVNPDEEASDEEPVSVSGLLRWQLKQELIFTTAMVTDDDEVNEVASTLFAKSQAQGVFPAHHGLDSDLEKMVGEAGKIGKHLATIVASDKVTLIPVEIPVTVKTLKGKRTIVLSGEIPVYESIFETQQWATVRLSQKTAYKTNAKVYAQCLFDHVVARELILNHGLKETRAFLVCTDGAYQLVDNPVHGVKVLGEWLMLYEQAMNLPMPVDCNELMKWREEGKDIDEAWKQLALDLIDNPDNGGGRRVSYFVQGTGQEQALCALLQSAVDLLCIDRPNKSNEALWQKIKGEK